MVPAMAFRYQSWARQPEFVRVPTVRKLCLRSVVACGGRVFHFNAFNAGEFLALFASGVCAFLWIRTRASRTVALASGFLYMLMLYHLAADFYRRTALSECWALAWMPLLLYFTTLAVVRKRTALLGVAFAYAFLILSHLVSVLIFSLIPLTLALVLFPP